MIWESLWLTLKLASITTLLLFIIGTPLAYWLSATKSKTKPIWETLVSMPLILPPTVLGFYLLIAFGQSSFLGKFLEDVFGLQLVFSFSGLVLASFIYSLPFMVHPIQSGFSSLPVYLKEAAYSLGKSKITTFFKILIPNIKPALLTGIVLSFAHTIGEFGVVLMIGGNLPGETRVASIAIYDEVEALNYSNANTLSLILFVLSFCILLCVYLINNKSLNRVVK
ncbi:MAG: molybdate ABC transporter permease subunit [Zunongwangia sp.]|uniref:molybdate ABC transporter permease subunit n=1 Tax=Zunongwangia sp. TaxID=1965325 RepID=UPI003241E246|tara:strand:+ start:506 stop:1177 length:672 start_codon:yes stop_codon:yes gene_type:complete